MNVAEAKKLFKSLKNKDFEKKVDDGNKLQYYYLLQTIQAKSSFPEHLSKSGPEFLQKNQPDTALLKKQNTRMWYTQSKVNLLREETEGFSYLMSMLWSDYSFEDISKAMGVFNICFSRVLELMAESLVHKPNTSTSCTVVGKAIRKMPVDLLKYQEEISRIFMKPSRAIFFFESLPKWSGESAFADNVRMMHKWIFESEHNIETKKALFWRLHTCDLPDSPLNTSLPSACFFPDSNLLPRVLRALGSISAEGLGLSILPSITLMDDQEKSFGHVSTSMASMSLKEKFEVFYYWDAMTKQDAFKAVTTTVSAALRGLLRRVSLENVENIAYLLPTLVHRQPFECFRIILTQVKSYANLIPIVARALKHLSPLMFDVISFCLLRSFIDAKPERHDERPFNSLCNFASLVLMRYPQAAFEPIVSHVVHQAYKGNWVPVNSLVTLFNEHGIEIDETFIKGTPPALKTVIQPIYQENRTFIKRFVATGCPLHKIPQPILFELVPNLFEFQDIMADFSNILDSCNKCVEHDMAGLNNHCETTVIHDVISAISRTTFVNVTQALQSLDKTTLHNFAVRLLSKISWVLLSGTLHEIQRVGAFVLNMFETIISKKPSESDFERLQVKMVRIIMDLLMHDFVEVQKNGILFLSACHQCLVLTDENHAVLCETLSMLQNSSASDLQTLAAAVFGKLSSAPPPPEPEN